MANAKDVMTDLEKFILDESDDLVDDLHKTIKINNPVDTGYSQSSWEVKKRITHIGETAHLDNPATYIGWIEMGTTVRGPNPFIKKSMTQVLNKRK